MKIDWIAHACFKVTMEDGFTILFDPFEDQIGYKLGEMDVDLLLSTHDHYDHNNFAEVKATRVICEEGEFNLENVKITGIPCFHDGEQGALRGKNIIYRVEAENMVLVHMGDIGHIPDSELYGKIGDVDILLVPVGGVYTVDAEQALEICEHIMPHMIIPMHYKTIFLKMDLASVYSFTDGAVNQFDRVHSGATSITVTPPKLKKRPRVIVLEPALDY